MEATTRKTLVEWNDTKRAYRLDRCVHELFEEQAVRTPAAVAVELEGTSLTYAELDRRANQLAHHLRAHGVSADVLVGLCVDRSLEMVVGLLGVLKAGGAYVPLDPGYPTERLDFMLADAAAPVLLTQTHLRARLGVKAGVKVTCLDGDWAEIAPRSGIRPDPLATPSHLAYVIYTSGSTGKPKGVAIPHVALSNHMQWLLDVFPMTADDRVLQKTPFSFDASVWEFYAPLLSGGRLVIARPGGHTDPTYLVETLKAKGITTLQLVPSLLRALVEQPHFGSCTSLKRLFCGGEVLTVELQNEVFGRLGVELVNLYGPTETTIDATYWVCQRGVSARSVPIGRPISNMKAYVLDDGGKPVPPATSGELYLAGVGLARGYVNRPELTAERFVRSPFADPDARMYRTGDLVRWTTDGVLEYQGRIDHQVKIRGFRIELEEIEAALGAHPAVRACAVLAREDQPGDKKLVAYVVGDVTKALLKEHLSAKVPEYMVPSVFVPLAALPLTANGKVDRRLLPAPPAGESTETRRAPTTPLETIVAEAWAQVMRVDLGELDTRADFYESGGDSLQAAMLTVELAKRLEVVLYVTAIFDAPTVESLARYLIDNYPEVAARFAGKTAVGAAPVRVVDAARLAEFKRYVIPLPPSSRQTAAKKNRSTVFLLSPPRSGSTLLRVMLAGHPRLFVPPECELLSFNTLQERKTALSGRDHWIAEGTIRALMEIHQCELPKAQAIMEAAERDGLSTQAFYGVLLDALGERILVDKTTTYGLDPRIVERGEREFEAPKYIHLTRHPYGMIRSFEQVRMDQIFLHGGRWSCPDNHAFTTRELGEMVWTVVSQNITAMLKAVPAHRQHHVRYEDLVSQPQLEMERMCRFLEIEFHLDMVDPYKDGKRRMTDGVHNVAESKMIGDVSFFTHKTIEADVATKWTKGHAEDFLGDLAWTLAEQFGYPRPRS